MNLDLLFDPLFRVPFATGLLLALFLPLLGLYLHLRQEWLAALGLSHIAGAGAVLAPLTGLAALPGAIAATLLVALLKNRLARHGNEPYAVLIVLGWALMILGAAFGHGQIDQTVLDGQLYFTGTRHLIAAALFAGAITVILPRLHGYLLRARLFPGQDAANGRPVRSALTLFDVAIAVAIALAATAMGVMATFALLLVIPWIVFAVASSWRRALLWSGVLGLTAYLLGFGLAVSTDLPFGPVLVLVLLALLPFRWVQRGPLTP